MPREYLTLISAVNSLWSCTAAIDAAVSTPASCSRDKHQYVIVRADIPTGLAGAMILHAAGETGPAPAGTVAILLSAADEPELRALAQLDPDSHLVVECDGPYAGQALAIGFPPRADKRRAYGHLRLWRGQQILRP